MESLVEQLPLHFSFVMYEFRIVAVSFEGTGTFHCVIAGCAGLDVWASPNPFGCYRLIQGKIAEDGSARRSAIGIVE